MSKKLSADSKTEMSQVCLRVKTVMEKDSIEVIHQEKIPVLSPHSCETGTGVGCLDLDSLESKDYFSDTVVETTPSIKKQNQLHPLSIVDPSDSEIQDTQVNQNSQEAQKEQEMQEIEEQLVSMTIEEEPRDLQHYVSYLIRYRIPNINPPNCSSLLPVDKYLIRSDFNCMSFPITQEEMEQEEGFKYKKSIRRKCRQLNISLSKIEKISHLETIESEHVCNHIYICDLNQFPHQIFPNIINTPASIQQPCWKDYYHLNLKSEVVPTLRLKTLDSQHIDLSVL